MYDFMELGSAPCSEDCKQVGSADPQEIREECWRYVEMLRKRFPIPEGVDARFTVKSFDHDFGGYAEAVVKFNDRNERSIGFAIHVENNLPELWTDEEVLPFVYVPEAVESY